VGGFGHPSPIEVQAEKEEEGESPDISAPSEGAQESDKEKHHGSSKSPPQEERSALRTEEACGQAPHGQASSSGREEDRRAEAEASSREEDRAESQSSPPSAAPQQGHEHRRQAWLAYPEEALRADFVLEEEAPQEPPEGLRGRAEAKASSFVEEAPSGRQAKEVVEEEVGRRGSTPPSCGSEASPESSSALEPSSPVE